MHDLETKYIKSLIDEIEVEYNEVNKSIMEINKDYQSKYIEVTSRIFENVSNYCKEEYLNLLNTHEIVKDSELNNFLILKQKENLDNTKENDIVNEEIRNTFNKCIDKKFGINKSIMMFEANLIKSDDALFECVNSIYLKERIYISEVARDKSKMDLKVNKDIKLKLSKCYDEYYKEVYTLYSENLNNLIKINKLIYLFLHLIPQNISIF